MRIRSTIWIAMAVLWSTSALVHAAPPTVTPSPGYDARLQEQRAASRGAATTFVPDNRPLATHRHRRTSKKHTQ